MIQIFLYMRHRNPIDAPDAVPQWIESGIDEIRAQLSHMRHKLTDDRWSNYLSEIVKSHFWPGVEAVAVVERLHLRRATGVLLAYGETSSYKLSTEMPQVVCPRGLRDAAKLTLAVSVEGIPYVEVISWPKVKVSFV